jgi:hypothetical protein
MSGTGKTSYVKKNSKRLLRTFAPAPKPSSSGAWRA